MDSTLFGQERISRILWRLAPPVMLAQLIQALYNIVDSFFVGKYSEAGLTALSIVYPLQLLMIALAVGTGVGLNTAIARYHGTGDHERAQRIAGTGLPLALALWVVFAGVSYGVLPAYAAMSSDSPEVIREVIVYGRIVCVASVGLFCESVWTKVLQADGDMKTPMLAQIAGAVTNIVLDPILIFGWGVPAMGIAGAAIATVAGQLVAAAIVLPRGYRRSPARQEYPGYLKLIYRLGTPNILMQLAYTFYILGLNLILSGFSDQAVTAVGQALKSSLLTVIRTVMLFVPLGYLFSRFGLEWFWLTFVCTEVLTSAVGLVFYRQFVKRTESAVPSETQGFCAARD